jgi:hypothetical protein
MASHRTKDRRKLLRSGVLGCVSGLSVTFQNNSLRLGCRLWLILRANAECSPYDVCLPFQAFPLIALRSAITSGGI